MIILGDCIEEMKKLPEKSVDCIIVDPPYGTTSCNWDIVIPFEQMWEEINRIKKETTPIIIFGQEPFSSLLRISNIEDFKYDIYWQKERITNIFQVKRRVGKDTETISVFYSKQCTYNPQMVKHQGKPVSNGDCANKKVGKLIGGEGFNRCKVHGYKDTGWRYPTQVLRIQRDAKNCQLHPTQKPVALMEWLVKTFTNEGDTVLDFCMGSGTTGVACKNLNRHFIGIEKDENYFNIAKERIEKA